jgi:hypothetical protein
LHPVFLLLSRGSAFHSMPGPPFTQCQVLSVSIWPTLAVLPDLAETNPSQGRLRLSPEPLHPTLPLLENRNRLSWRGALFINDC